MSRPHVQVILADPAVPTGLRDAVRQTAASASFCPLAGVLQDGAAPAADAVVVVVPDNLQDVAHPLRILFDRLADQPRAVLLLKAAGGPIPPVAHPPTVPVTFGCGLGAAELAARLETMLQMRASLDSLHQGLVARQRSEESAVRRYMGQLRLASQVQREFLPGALPEVDGITFDTLFRPADYVSGDIYDVRRLDEEHVAIALADATGHGVPAALLTVFIKRAFRGREMQGGQYRVLGPDEVLLRLNEDLLEANLSACPFVAATYGLLNTRTRTLRLARAGSPYPLLRRADGTLHLLQPAGGVVGVCPDVQFAVEEVELAPGDTVLFCSDGLERIILPQLPVQALAEAFRRAAESAEFHGDVLRPAERHRDPASGAPPVTAGAAHSAWNPGATTAVLEAPPGVAGRRSEVGGNGRSGSDVLPHRERRGEAPAPRKAAGENGLRSSTWCQILRAQGPGPALDQLRVRHEALRRMGYPLDDLTVVAVQVGRTD